MKITPAQLARLQTVCSQMAQRVAGYTNSREERLAWANTALQLPEPRHITSFSQLTGAQAGWLIDAAQGEVGHRAPRKPRSKAQQPRTTSTHRAGVDGRATDTFYLNQPEILAPEELEVIASYYQRLGWDRAQFDAWLSGRRSPIRPARQIRTVRQANRVRWALKGMLQAQGLWADWSNAA